MIRRARPCSLGLAAFLAVLLQFASAATASALTDPEVVYCLSDQGRPQVRDAAVALGSAEAASERDQILEAGKEISLQRWRRAHAAEFSAACSASYIALRDLPAAGSTRSSAPTSWLLIVLPTLTGAFLTLFVTQWRDGVARRRAQAESLRSVGAEFAAATTSLVEARRARQAAVSDASFSVAKMRLRVALMIAVSDLPNPASARQAIATLGTDEFGPTIMTRWSGEGPPLEQRQKELDSALDELLKAVEEAARAVHHPGSGVLRRMWFTR